eukprot:8954856-Heterocapsa_arctica.AAC.1
MPMALQDGSWAASQARMRRQSASDHGRKGTAVHLANFRQRPATRRANLKIVDTGRRWTMSVRIMPTSSAQARQTPARMSSRCAESMFRKGSKHTTKHNDARGHA